MFDAIVGAGWRLAQPVFYIATLLSAILAYACCVIVVMIGGLPYWLLPLGMLVLSPVSIAVLRWMCEQRSLKGFLRPSVMSMTFVLGDVIVLPLLLLYAGYGREQLPPGGFYNTMLFCVLAGLAGGCVSIILRVIDGRRYVAAGMPTALHSPTKVWHSLAVVPAVTASSIWLLIPLAVNWSMLSVAPILLLMVCIGLCLRDVRRRSHLQTQHPEWDWKRFQTL